MLERHRLRIEQKKEWSFRRLLAISSHESALLDHSLSPNVGRFLSDSFLVGPKLLTSKHMSEPAQPAVARPGPPRSRAGCEQAGDGWGERVADRTTEKDRGSGGDVSSGVSHGGF
jgi:hypothetical protein